MRPNKNRERVIRMHVKQFRDLVNAIADDVGCDGGARIGSHKIPSSVSFYVDNDDDSEYELIEIETDRLIGCGCASGITFRLKKL